MVKDLLHRGCGAYIQMVQDFLDQPYEVWHRIDMGSDRWGKVEGFGV